MKILYTALATAFVLGACKTPNGGSSGLTGGVGNVLSVDKMDSEATFNAFAKDGGGVILGGKSVKFLVDKHIPGNVSVHFINGNYKDGTGVEPQYSQYHYYFAQQALGNTDSLNVFNDSTYFTQNKRYVAGTLRTYEYDGGTIYGVQLYPQDVAKEKTIAEFMRIVKDYVTIPGARLAFVATGQQQETKQIGADLASLGVLNLTIEQILGATRYIPMNVGEAWGYLRIFPQDPDDLSAVDIPVFDELPLDLTVVAGVMTRAFQDTNSHVNLKSKERKTPNMILRDAGPSHPELAPWANKPIHLSVTVNGFKIEASSDEEVRDRLGARLNKPWQTMHWTPETMLTAYDDMCSDNPKLCFAYSLKVGAKAANLGFLANRKVLGRVGQAGALSNDPQFKYDLTPRGFGIPFKYYADFVNLPANLPLKQRLAKFIAEEKQGVLTTNQRRAAVEEIKQLFYRGKFPTAALNQITSRITSLMPGIKKFKMRSSANAEDIEGFDGAGLYNSFTANVEKEDNPDGSCQEVPDEDENSAEAKTKMKPNTVNCAIKGVYASLWTKRGIEERSFARLDHESVAMGVAVVPKYDTESEVAANSVVVTRVLNAKDVYGYQLSIQKDNNLVTNPDPGTHTEVTIAGFISDNEPISFTTTRYAKPKRVGDQLKTNVLSNANLLKMVRIAKTVELAYCRYKDSYYPGGADQCPFGIVNPEKPKSLDMEFKFLQNGEFVCKQVREFSGR